MSGYRLSVISLQLKEGYESIDTFILAYHRRKKQQKRNWEKRKSLVSSVELLARLWLYLSNGAVIQRTEASRL